MFATLEEQRAARRWRSFIRLAWLAFFVFLLWALMHRGAPSTDRQRLTRRWSRSRARSRRGRGQCRKRCRGDARRLRGHRGPSRRPPDQFPGGSPVQAGIINDEIKRLRVKHKKPVYAVVEESCASAAYYIAAATDRIFVDKASIVGSIGVLMDGFVSPD